MDILKSLIELYVAKGLSFYKIRSLLKNYAAIDIDKTTLINRIRRHEKQK